MKHSRSLLREYCKNISPSGPLFERVEFIDGQAIVHFTYAESGLMVAIKNGLAAPKKSPQTKFSSFELADTQGHWHPAEAVVAGRTVIVRSEELTKPVAVCYVYAVDPQHCHLYNHDGLPASPFCSDPSLMICEPDLPEG